MNAATKAAKRRTDRRSLFWTARSRASIKTALGRAHKRSRKAGAQVAQLVEHCTENAGVGGSIPPLGTITAFHSSSHTAHSELISQVYSIYLLEFRCALSTWRTCDSVGTMWVQLRIQLFHKEGRTHMLLTQFAIKNAKPREKPYKLADGNGLYPFGEPERQQTMASSLPL